MTTNILATILVCLVTNVTERIHVPDNQYLDAVDLVYRPPGSPSWHYTPPPPPQKKYVTTEVYDQRLLILEAEGQTFTNTLASVLKLRKVETFIQRIPQAPAPTWEQDEARTSVETNFTSFSTNGWQGQWNILVATNHILTLTNNQIWLKPTP